MLCLETGLQEVGSYTHLISLVADAVLLLKLKGLRGTSDTMKWFESGGCLPWQVPRTMEWLKFIKTP